MLHAATSTNSRPARVGHRPRRRPLSAEALAGIAALGQTVDTIRTSRFKWLGCRERPLAELGRAAESLGPAAAREIAELLLQRVADGEVATSKEAGAAAREIALHFRGRP